MNRRKALPWRKNELDYILLNRYCKFKPLNLQKRYVQGLQSLNKATSGASAGQTALLQSHKRRYSSNPMALRSVSRPSRCSRAVKISSFKLKALRGELDQLPSALVSCDGPIIPADEFTMQVDESDLISDPEPSIVSINR
jgi:hypothetical protein